MLIESSELNAHGFVVDYRDLDWFKRLLDQDYDHRDLNNVVLFNPTAELLAKHFHDKMAKWLADTYPESIFIVVVGVSETAKTWATYMTDLTVDEDFE